MKMLTSTWHKGMTAAAGGLLLVSQVPAGDLDQARVDSVRMIGNLVEILVTVPGDRPVEGRVVLLATTGGRTSVVTIPFTGSEGQKVFVHWCSPVRLDEIPEAGVIIDDGPPF
jgi:hypothetical protein